MADASEVRAFAATAERALQAVVAAREAIAIGERVIALNHELEAKLQEVDPDSPEGMQTLTMRVHVATGSLMPGFTFDFEELAAMVRDALRDAVEAKRAELAQ